MKIAVFFIAPAGRDEVYLRRYVSGSRGKCQGPDGYHNAMMSIGEQATTDAATGDYHPHDDPRWSTTCTCGYQFTDEDEWQLFRQRIYRRADTGSEMTLRSAPVGACWDATWFVDRARDRQPCFNIGDDGRCLVVKTPGGDWMIDSRARNCTMPDDTVHKCWVRHGSPENGTLHVDKQGTTCAAGAGSIQAGSYHGFLHHGHLTEC